MPALTVPPHLRRWLSRAERHVSSASHQLSGSKPGLISFIFHSLFNDEREVESGHLDPGQRLTTSGLRHFIEQLLAANIELVSPYQIGELCTDTWYALLTFDDGYYNNVHLLPVLEEFNVPATLFVCSGPIRSGQSFWWDVVYREERRRGRNSGGIWRLQQKLQGLSPGQLDRELKSTYGERCFQPRCDLDRPLTESELAEVAAHPLITIGNHSEHHELLTHPSVDAPASIRAGHDFLCGVLGTPPNLIAYPNGSCDSEILSYAASLGYRYGWTTAPRKDSCPLSNPLALGRFSIEGGSPPRAQIAAAQSDFNPRNSIRRWTRLFGDTH